MNPEAFDRLFKMLGVAAKDCADKMCNLTALSDKYIPLIERFPELLDEPDKNVGFTLVNNNTWLPKALIDARLKNQRHVARQSEKHIIWTR